MSSTEHEVLERRALGKSGISISPIGLGSWALGSAAWDFGWGSQSRSDSVGTIEAALEMGINWIDTAPIYGLGQVEELLGDVLADLPPAKRPMVFSKCSLRWDASGAFKHSLERESITAEVDESLRRLRLESLDLCQIHWPAYGGSGGDERIEEAVDALARLRQAGKIRAIGLSNFDVKQLLRALRVTEIAAIQSPYSILRRNIEEEILPFCAREGLGVLVYSALQSGLLSGAMTRERIDALPDDDWRKTKNPDFQEPQLTRALSLVERMKRIAERGALGVAEIAIAWTLQHPAVTGAIVGARRPTQLRETLPAAELTLTPSERAELGA